MRVTYEQLVSRAREQVRAMSPSALSDLLTRPDAPIVLDLREAAECGDGSVPGALHLPRGLLEKHIGDLVPAADRQVALICQSGHRSILAALALREMGFSQVTTLEGGVNAWRAASLPMQRTRALSEQHGAQFGETAPATSQGPLSWEQVRAAFPIVGRQVPVMGQTQRPLVYLDHAASTHAPTPVLQRYSEFMAGEYANVHRGTHLLSRKATERFDECYYVVSDFIGGDLERDCVVFLGNTTQAIDLAAHVMESLPGKTLVTQLEHHSNDLPHRKRGPVLRAPIDVHGRLNLDALEQLLRANDVKLVAVTGAANLNGWMPDIYRVARLAHQHGALILVDAAQLLAHQRIDVRPPDHEEHIDFLAAAGHKAYAPFGAAFLYGPRAILDAAPPYLPGGGTAARVHATSVDYVPSPDRHQGGTPNIGGVLALAEALRFLDRIGMDRVREHEVALTRRAMDGMRAIGGVTIYGPAPVEERLGVLCFNVDGVSDQLAAAVLSEEHALAIRNGRFCAHIHMERLLANQGGATAEDGSVPGAARASFGAYNDESDVDRLLVAIKALRDRSWVGRYRVRAAGITAEFAGRCNDRWMEADSPGPSHDDAVVASEEQPWLSQLNPDPPIRSYLIADAVSGKAILVDPRRDQVDRYLAELARRRLTLEYAVDTHTHSDHLSGCKRLKDLVGCKIAMHASAGVPCVDHPLEDGDRLLLGSLAIDVLHTPGHTRDSLCLRVGDDLLTGDTLWIGGSGGLDLEGDVGSLRASLTRIAGLPAQTRVWPLHDSEVKRHSTIQAELAANPWMTRPLPCEGDTAATAAKPDAIDNHTRANQRCSA